MFTFTFYFFSSILSFTDIQRFIVPNIIISTMFLMLLFVGFIENTLLLSSFIVSLIVLGLFIVLLLLSPKMILGGGDIKYMMIVAFYLPFTMFPLFLIVTGILQSLALLYTQKVRKRKIVAMVPVMFISVVVAQLINYLGFYPLG